MRIGLIVLVSGLLFGCPDDDDGGNAGADMAVGAGGMGGGAGGMGGGAGGMGGASGLCDVIDCSGHGTCVEIDGLPACECDEGYMLQGLECVDRLDNDAPADFECPAPGGDGDPQVAALTRQAYAHVNNDRTCEVASRTILIFRDTGVFVFRDQDDGAMPGDGGSVLYGCWSVAETAADRVTINYDYGEQTFRNCGAVGGLDDPPCTGVLSYVEDEDALLLIANEEAHDERILLHAVPSELDCVFCGDDPGCCAQNSWVADFEGPICQ